MGQQKSKLDAGKKKKNRLTADQKKALRWGIALVALFTILIVLGFAVSNDWFEGFGPACKVGDVEISKEEYNFNFYSNYSSFLNYYSGSISAIGLDTSKPLSSQQYSEDKTWQDFFDEQTYKNLADAVAMSEAAKKAGVSLNEDNQKQVDNYIESIKSGAKANNVSFGSYTRQVYGRKMNEEQVRSAMSRVLLADQYAAELHDSYEIGDDAIEKEYTDNKDTYDKVTYRVITVEADIPSGGDMESDEYEKAVSEAMTAAKTKADELMKEIAGSGRVTETHFAKVAMEYAKETADDEEKAAEITEDDSRKIAAGIKSVTDEEGAKWLFDPARKNLDTSLIEEADAYSIYLFVERTRDDYAAVNVRHILVPFNDDIKDAKDDAEDAAAKAKAEEYMNEFKAAGATEEAFAELAKKYGKDATTDKGGLMEDVVKGQMVETFNDWIFDPARKPGDYDFVRTEYGWHLVYFSGTSRLAYKITVEEAIRQRSYNEEYDGIMANYPVTVNGIEVYRYSR